MSRWWYLVPIVLIAGATSLGAWVGVNAIVDLRDSFHRMAVPGEMSFSAERAGRYTLYNEIRGRFEDERFVAGPQEGLRARIVDADGQPLKLLQAAGKPDYAFGGREGIALAHFEITEPGTYRLQARFADGHEPTAGVLTVSNAAVVSQMRLALLPLIACLVCVAWGLIAIAYISRSRIGRLVDYESRAVPTITSVAAPAGVLRRIVAAVIDLVVLLGLLMLLSDVLKPFFSHLEGLPAPWEAMLVWLTCALSLFVYFLVLEALLGWTPGKLVLSSRVVTAEGRLIGWERSFVRNTVRFVDFLPTAYLVGLIAAISSRRNRRLGDLAADTLVVIR